MPGREAPLYRRGDYELRWDCRSDGSLRSPYLAIFWYEAGSRRVRSASTRTADTEEAMIALDRRYLADRGQAPAYCGTCGQPIAHASAYLLTDAIADYRLEIGDERSSADTIQARLKHVLDFLEADGRISATCADAASPVFAERLRAWSAKQPVEWRNKGGKVTGSRPRLPATTEASVMQLCAVLNHAVAQRRSDARPSYRPMSPKRVSQPRRVRCDEAALADMLAYAAAPERAGQPLHAFLVASLCTMARPDSVLDIAVAAKRRQWWRTSTTIDLNPAGRAQTKKHRPVLPVLPVLGQWLLAALKAEEALKEDERLGGWLVNWRGRPVVSVRKGWGRMLAELKLPAEREWQPYLLRHSLATMVRERGARKWELEAFLGHRDGSSTETYAVARLFPTVSDALLDIQSKITARSPGVLLRTNTGAAANVLDMGGRQMPAP